jgi:L-malate glycosyltransferase
MVFESRACESAAERRTREEPMLTVLIATRNGRKTLPAVLDSYRRVKSPAGGYKIVVVDNASTDGTADVAAQFRDSLPLTVLSEPQSGKNAALNSGLASAEGDLVVFTDDDAFPHEDLLVRLREAADDHEAYSIFGGAVLPRWETPPPAWLLDWVPRGPVFTLTTASLPDGPTDFSNVFGPNMAVRTAVFAAGYRFDASIGPRGKAYAMGSETELLQRLVNHGHKVWHVAGAVVEHFIRASQMNVAWIRGRAVRFGRGEFRLAQAQAAARVTSWWGVPRYLLRRMVEQSVRMLGAYVSFDRRGMFLARWEFNRLWGAAVEARVMRSEQARGVGR